MMYTQPANHNSRRSFLRAIGGLGSLALAPWSRALGAESRVKDLIILLPGITGSVLQKNKKDVWAVTTESVGGALTTFGRNLEGLELKEDPQDVEDLGDGVVATGLFPDVHLIPGFWKIDGYGSVRAALSQRLKLDGAQNYIEFPYDWRRDNRVAARKLARLVPAWLAQWKKVSGNDDAKVVLIAHSMGGLVARYYLECLEGWRYARKLITFGTPYRGSLNALDFLSNGYVKTFAGFNVADLSALMRSFTSVYQLLPRYPCVDMGDGVMRRPGEVSGLPNIDPAKAAAALAFHRELDRAICANAESKEYKPYLVHPIIGTDQPTKQSAHIRAGRLVAFNELNGADDSGDGTVPRPSALPLGCTREDDEAFGRAALFVSGIHGSLQNLPQVVAQVSYVLLEPKFEAYRPASDAFSLGVDDAYLVGEPVRIRCDAGTMAAEALLIVEEAATAKQVFKGNLVPQSSEPISVEHLPMGTYRAALEVGGRRLISDVFLVSR
jgi:pimeloyl-ACP methyl ester carboxylesterase